VQPFSILGQKFIRYCVSQTYGSRKKVVSGKQQTSADKAECRRPGNRPADSHLGQAAYVSLNAEGRREKAHTPFKRSNYWLATFQVPGRFH